jgi:flavodoxin
VSIIADEGSLIIYFSLTGNTKSAAEKLQKKTGAAIYQLQPEKPYPTDYNGIVAACEKEKDNQIHPKLGGNLPDFNQYSKIYVGYPTWWSQPPMIIHSLFEQGNFTGKEVVAFSTSASTPLADTVDVIQKLAKENGATFVVE